MAGRGNNVLIVLVIRKITQPDTFLNGQRLVLTQPLGPKGMAATHEQLKNQHAQTKAVVLGQTLGVAKVYALQFGRGIFWFAYGAGVNRWPLILLNGDLEGVGINQGNHGRGVDQDVAFIQIAHNIPMWVQRAKRGC